VSSAESSPFHRPSGAPVQIKQTSSNQAGKIPVSDRILLDIHGPSGPGPARGPDHGPRQAARHAEHVPKPARTPELAREIKKLDLHNKYTKIIEEKKRKQGLLAEGAEGVEHSRERPKIPTPGAADIKPARKPAEMKPKPPVAHKLRSRTSYAEVDPDFEITVEPVSNRSSQPDADIWMRVKHRTMPKKMDGSVKSSSSSNLTGSDYYSNLAELDLEGGVGGVAHPASSTDSMERRRHSISEGQVDRVSIRTGLESSSR
jgi:hypothetical protein